MKITIKKILSIIIFAFSALFVSTIVTSCNMINSSSTGEGSSTKSSIKVWVEREDDDTTGYIQYLNPNKKATIGVKSSGGSKSVADLNKLLIPEVPGLTFGEAWDTASADGFKIEVSWADDRVQPTGGSGLEGIKITVGGDDEANFDPASTKLFVEDKPSIKASSTGSIQKNNPTKQATISVTSDKPNADLSTLVVPTAPTYLTFGTWTGTAKTKTLTVAWKSAITVEDVVDGKISLTIESTNPDLESVVVRVSVEDVPVIEASVIGTLKTGDRGRTATVIITAIRGADLTKLPDLTSHDAEHVTISNWISQGDNERSIDITWNNTFALVNNGYEFTIVGISGANFADLLVNVPVTGQASIEATASGYIQVSNESVAATIVVTGRDEANLTNLAVPTTPAYLTFGTWYSISSTQSSINVYWKLAITAENYLVNGIDITIAGDAEANFGSVSVNINVHDKPTVIATVGEQHVQVGTSISTTITVTTTDGADLSQLVVPTATGLVFGSWTSLNSTTSSITVTAASGATAGSVSVAIAATNTAYFASITATIVIDESDTETGLMSASFHGDLDPLSDDELNPRYLGYMQYYYSEFGEIIVSTANITLTSETLKYSAVSGSSIPSFLSISEPIINDVNSATFEIELDIEQNIIAGTYVIEIYDENALENKVQVSIPVKDKPRFEVSQMGDTFTSSPPNIMFALIRVTSLDGGYLNTLSIDTGASGVTVDNGTVYGETKVFMLIVNKIGAAANLGQQINVVFTSPWNNTEYPPFVVSFPITLPTLDQFK